MVYNTNINKYKAKIAILIPNKTNFRPKKITSYREKHIKSVNLPRRYRNAECICIKQQSWKLYDTK